MRPSRNIFMKPFSELSSGLSGGGRPRMSPDSESGVAKPLHLGPAHGSSCPTFILYVQSQIPSLFPVALCVSTKGNSGFHGFSSFLKLCFCVKSLFGNRTHTVIPTEGVSYSLQSIGCLEDKWGDSKVIIEVSTGKGSFCSGLGEPRTGACSPTQAGTMWPRMTLNLWLILLLSLPRAGITGISRYAWQVQYYYYFNPIYLRQVPESWTEL